MEKRDIRINYDMLETLLSRLEIYSKALDTMDKAMDKVNKAITENDSKSIRQLNKRYKKAKKRLTKSISEVYTLYESLDNYVNDMRAIIKPLRGNTRVGRNDIYMNLQSMSFYMTEISALRTALLPETTETESMIEEDKQKMQRNYQKFYLEIQGTILQNLTEDMRDLEDTLKNDYYKKKVVKYENKDDEHRWRTEAIRQFLSSPLDRIKQNAIDWETFVSDVKNGVKMAVLGLIEGLASLMVIVYYGWRADVALLVEATATDPPDWVDDALRDYDEYVYPLTEVLTDPVAVVESLAQTASDTYEKEGGTYIASYVITDIVVGKMLSDITKIDGTGTKGKGGKKIVTSTLGNEIDITPSANHTSINKNPGPFGKANTSVDILDADGNIKTRRWYDSNGKAYRDVDMSDHGNPKEHPEVPHEHTWEYNDGKPKRN